MLDAEQNIKVVIMMSGFLRSNRFNCIDNTGWRLAEGQTNLDERLITEILMHSAALVSIPTVSSILKRLTAI